jgi:hypothetical protein
MEAKIIALLMPPPNGRKSGRPRKNDRMMLNAVILVARATTNGEKYGVLWQM